MLMKVGDFIKILPFITFIGIFVFLFQKEWMGAVALLVISVFLFVLIYTKVPLVKKVPLIILFITIILLLNKEWLLAGIFFGVLVVAFWWISLGKKK